MPINKKFIKINFKRRYAYMSIVIAIKYKNGVLIGSDKQGTCGNMAGNNV